MSNPVVDIDVSMALPYPANNVQAIACSLSKIPAEGFRSISFAFNFTESLLWYLNFTAQFSTQTFSAIRSLFVDATASAHDVKIFNFATGHVVTVQAGSSGFYPFITIDGDLSFYVSLVNAVLPSTDIVNVYALNAYTPPASFPDYERVLISSLNGTTIMPVQAPTMSGNSVIAGNGGTKIIIDKNTWYLDNIALVFCNPNGYPSTFNFNLQDGSTIIYASGLITIQAEADLAMPPFAPKYVSTNTNPLTIVATDVLNGNLTNCSLNFAYS